MQSQLVSLNTYLTLTAIVLLSSLIKPYRSVDVEIYFTAVRFDKLETGPSLRGCPGDCCRIVQLIHSVSIPFPINRCDHRY